MFIREKKTFALEYQGKVIGSLGIDLYNETDYPELAPLSGREIGYVLSKDYWGQGLMPEAVNAVIRYLFEVEDLDFLICGHFERNARSRRVIEKCGFRYIRTVRFRTEYNTEDLSMEYVLFHPKRREQ
jgi:ribosomal-protein-alanine N-acetyltransferase